MKKVITIGGATQDIFLHLNVADTMKLLRNLNETRFFIFESGEKVEVETITYYTGGGATNSATSFSRLGLNTSCFSLVGYDGAARSILDDLEKEGISTGLIVKTEAHSTGTSYIISSPHCEQTIFTYRGANSFLDLNTFPIAELDGTDYLYITSLSSSSSEHLEALALQAKKKQVSIAINPGLTQIVKATNTIKKSLQAVDVFILNTTEAKTFMLTLIETDEKLRSTLISKEEKTICPPDISLAEPCLLLYPIVTEHVFFSIHKFFKEILSMGPKIVVLTNGANGVYVATPEMILFHPSLPTNIVNTVGAGDSFGSTFIASMARGLNIQDALRNGIINSASVIGAIGAKAGLLTWTELQEKRARLDSALLKQFNW